jgi:hypothetical protein
MKAAAKRAEVLKHSKNRLNHPLLKGFNKPGGFVVKAKEHLLMGLLA